MINLKDAILKYHRHLSADQWNALLKLEKLTDILGNKRYYMGEAIEHNDLDVSEYEYNELVNQEESNNETLECIITFFEKQEWERMDEVFELIAEDVKQAIEETSEKLSVAA